MSRCPVCHRFPISPACNHPRPSLSIPHRRIQRPPRIGDGLATLRYLREVAGLPSWSRNIPDASNPESNSNENAARRQEFNVPVVEINGVPINDFNSLPGNSRNEMNTDFEREIMRVRRYNVGRLSTERYQDVCKNFKYLFF